MKKSILVLIAVIAIIGLMAGTGIATGAANMGNGPNLVIATPVSELGEPVVILGSGFEPGETIRLVFDTGGSRIDIEYGLAETGHSQRSSGVSPVANDTGAFIAAWEPGRIASRVIASGRGGPGAGAYTIMATDTDYVTLTTTPIAFWEAVDEGEELPAWAQ